MKICNHLLIAFVALAFSVGAARAQSTHTYSKAVQKACANDYHKHCGQYGMIADRAKAKRAFIARCGKVRLEEA
jgi:hypothetical protein